jgi:hypothetical protein
MLVAEAATAEERTPERLRPPRADRDASICRQCVELGAFLMRALVGFYSFAFLATAAVSDTGSRFVEIVGEAHRCPGSSNPGPPSRSRCTDVVYSPRLTDCCLAQRYLPRNALCCATVSLRNGTQRER